MSGTDGGPAFPQPDLSAYGMGPRINEDEKYEMAGMSLRDWFAGQAVAAMVGGTVASSTSTGPDDAPLFAKAAYILADAMLAERAK